MAERLADDLERHAVHDRVVDQAHRSKPTVFACNGAECWKSYKASRVALAAGLKEVYWFRGGLPEWEAAGLDVAKD